MLSGQMTQYLKKYLKYKVKIRKIRKISSFKLSYELQ